jgi:hypothetical protein
MASAETLAEARARLREVLVNSPGEYRLLNQSTGNKPDDIGKAAAR